MVSARRSASGSAAGQEEKRELFYRNDKKMLALTEETSPEFRAGTPRVLFEGAFMSSTPAFGYPRYDVRADGQRFSMVMSEEEAAPSRLHVVLDWFEELKRLVPTHDNDGGSYTRP